MTRAVFLDRDGVVNEVVERDGEIGSPRSMREFQPVADLSALSRLEAAGLRLFIVTNQPDIARGHVSEATVVAMIERIRAQAPVADYRICAHEDGHGCGCRKPKPGMILELARCWHVDVAGSYLVGDTWRDVEAARAAGCRSLLVRRPYNADVTADGYVDSLSAAVDAVIEQYGS